MWPMPRTVLQIIALLPIPIILALVYFVGQRPLPKDHLPQGGGSTGAARSGQTALELPAGFKPGWKLVGKPERYDKKTLFDRIDGAAPAYLRAGFVYSVGAEYKKEGMEEPVVVDVYDMGTPNQGLGMYSTERDLSYKFIKVGDDGYLATGSLNFWTGQFYIKLAGYGEGESMDQALMEVARGVALTLEKLKAKKGGEERLILKRLPAAGRVPHSDGYSHPPLGDVDGLERVFFADYKESKEEEGEVYRLFVIHEKSPAAAEARAAKVKAYFEKDGAKVQLEQEGALSIYTIIGDSTSSVLLAQESMIFGALDLSDAEQLSKVGVMLRQAIKLQEQP